MKHSPNIIFIIALALGLSACQSSMNRLMEDERGANVYSTLETGRLSNVLSGKILSVREVTLSGSRELGTSLGAVVGVNVAENAAGSDKEKLPAAVVGGLIGALAGGEIEEGLTAGTGYEFLLKMSNGKIQAFVQKSHQDLKVGDEVYIIQNQKTVRLRRI